MAKTMVGFEIKGYRNAVEERYCKNGNKGMNEFLGITPCLNTAMKEVDKCFFKAITNLHAVRNTTDDLKMPHICW